MNNYRKDIFQKVFMMLFGTGLIFVSVLLIGALEENKELQRELDTVHMEAVDGRNTIGILDEYIDELEAELED